jgi:hypothetical protein
MNITVPIVHVKVLGALYDPYYKPLPMCKYTKKKKADAVLECKYLINQPLFTSLIICSTESKASNTLGV